MRTNVKIIYLHISTKFYIPLISNSYINLFTTTIAFILVYYNSHLQYTHGTDVKRFIRSHTVQIIYILQYTIMATSSRESKVALKHYQGNLGKKPTGKPVLMDDWTGLLKTLISFIHWLNLVIQWINFNHRLIFVAQILSTG